MFNKKLSAYEFNGDGYKNQLVGRYLEIIRPYLKDIINKCKESDKWRTQLSVTIAFRSSKNIDEYPYMY